MNIRTKICFCFLSLTFWVWLPSSGTHAQAKPKICERNLAWSKLIHADMAHVENLKIIQAYLKDHEYEPRVTSVDLRVFKAIEASEQSLKEEQAELKVIREQLATKEVE